MHAACYEALPGTCTTRPLNMGEILASVCGGPQCMMSVRPICPAVLLPDQAATDPQPRPGKWVTLLMTDHVLV